METVSNIVPYFRKELSSIFEDREVISWAYLSVEHLLGYSRSDCITHAKSIIDPKISDDVGFLISIVGAITFASSGSYFNINAPWPEYLESSK